MQKLKRKYGPELEDVLNYAAQAQEELDSLLRGRPFSGTGAANVRRPRKKLGYKRAGCTQKDDKRLPSWKPKLASHLQDLGMTPTLQFAIDETSELGPDGCDRVELLFSAKYRRSS